MSISLPKNMRYYRDWIYLLKWFFWHWLKKIQCSLENVYLLYFGPPLVPIWRPPPPHSIKRVLSEAFLSLVYSVHCKSLSRLLNHNIKCWSRWWYTHRSQHVCYCNILTAQCAYSKTSTYVCYNTTATFSPKNICIEWNLGFEHMGFALKMVFVMPQI